MSAHHCVPLAQILAPIINNSNSGRWRWKGRTENRNHSFQGSQSILLLLLCVFLQLTSMILLHFCPSQFQTVCTIIYSKQEDKNHDFMCLKVVLKLVPSPLGQVSKPMTLSRGTPANSIGPLPPTFSPGWYQAFSQQTFQKAMINWLALVLPPIKLMRYCRARNYSQTQSEKAGLLNDNVTGEKLT